MKFAAIRDLQIKASEVVEPKFRRRIEEGLRDIKAGRVVSHEDLKSRLQFKLRRARRAAR